MSTTQTAYDTVAYPGFTYPDTHPDRMAVMALLYGLEPAPLEGCRVLEIGCNEGANLIPMAYAMPDARFVGFDLAGTPIEYGQQRIRELGLQNISLFQADLLEVGSELGEFDYIIAHGLYAWIPDRARDGLLARCKRNLAPNGVAFISYNAFPGGHIRHMLRDMMLFRAKDIESPDVRVNESVDLLQLVAQMRPENDPYRLVVEDQLKRLRKGRAHAIFHDDLTPAYRPVHFAEFVNHAQCHGLQFLSEAVLPTPQDPCFNPEFQQSIKNIAGDDLIAQEQLLDFARMRMYRQTLLCHSEHKLQREFPAGQFQRLLFASSAESKDGETPGTKTYTLPTCNRTLQCDQPVTIAVLEQLIAEWPRTLNFDQVFSTLSENGVSNVRDASMLLLQMAVAQMIELHSWQAPVAGKISDRPRASAVIRQEARLHPYASTLWHFTLELNDPVSRSFVQLLDGTRDCKALLDALKAEFPVTPLEVLEVGIETHLKFVHRAALLEA
ncbi:MAG TPA: class I SAM-dependent methyltransferase [Pseudacidobacterium sp.]|jgi:SAM-dependent methyltransferase|nr:class I SAM-dependent methyltransferase [Pseudacidobacterium sp.]